MKIELVRDDGKRLKLYGNGIHLEANDNLFPSRTLRTSLFNYADADGGQMVKQNYDSYTFGLNGFVEGADDTARFRTSQNLTSFLAKNHYFTALFTLCDGTMMQLKNIWISEALSLVMRGMQMRPMFTLGLTAGDPYFYSYAENEQGEIVYASRVELARMEEIADMTGYAYSSGGYIYYGGGYYYIGASVSIPEVYIDSIVNVSPIWQVNGQCTNPVLTNYTTNTKLIYKGTISKGQTLVVDCNKKQAFIGTADVTKNISGTWVYLTSGNNKISYESENTDDTKTSTLMWNGVIM